MTQPLTEDEKKTLKNAAYGAVFLVSHADPGFLAMFKESFAASKALAASTGIVRDALTTGGVPNLPKSSVADVEASVLPGLTQSVQILQAKAPAEAESYKLTVIDACTRVAEAVDGVKDTETAELTRIRGALGG